MRDPVLGRAALEDGDIDKMIKVVVKWAEEGLGGLRGRMKLTEAEQNFFPGWIKLMSLRLREALRDGSWKSWPKEPGLGMDADPLEIMAKQLEERGGRMKT